MYTLMVLVYYKKRQSVDFWMDRAKNAAHGLNTIDIQAGLRDYPVIDEQAWSELEHEEAQRIWSECYNDSERLAYVREYRDQFEFCDYGDLIGCIRGKYFCGYASELISR